MTELSTKLAILGLSGRLSKLVLRKKLNAILKSTHPDATGGNFNDAQQETRYTAAVEVLEIINSPKKISETGKEIQLLTKNQTALAKTQSSILEMMHEQREQEKITQQQASTEAAETKAGASIARAMRQTYAPLKVGALSISVIAAIVGALDKPLGGFIEGLFPGSVGARYAKIVLGLISIIGAFLALYAKQREIREADRLKSIMTDAGIHYLFYRYGYLIFAGENEEGKKTLSLLTLANAIAEHTQIQDMATCEATAGAILKKLIQRGVLNFTAAKSLSPIYTVDQELEENLDHGVSWSFSNERLVDKMRARIKRFLSNILKWFKK
jgi:hypothetical protein